MSDKAGRIALVTGANRGIGFEVCRQLARKGFVVLLSARNAEKAKGAAGALKDVGRVEPIVLNVDDATTIAEAAAEVNSQYGHLDVLINNAGINYDIWETAENADIDGTVMETITTNLLGPWRVCQAFVPLLCKSRAGRIVNVSSESGSLTEMGAGPPAYQVTKAALNALTRTLAAELRSRKILVNSVCPGWVATDMGGAGAPRSVQEGAAGIVWAATLPDDGPTGSFFRDGKPHTVVTRRRVTFSSRQCRAKQIRNSSKEEQVLSNNKPASAVRKSLGDFAPKLVDLTDDVFLAMYGSGRNFRSAIAAGSSCK